MTAETVVLAYSGGLDTSVAVAWLQEQASEGLAHARMAAIRQIAWRPGPGLSQTSARGGRDPHS